MLARFISLTAVAFADDEGLHHLNEAAAVSLLQTSSSMKIAQDPNTIGAKGGGGAKGFGAKTVPKIPSPAPTGKGAGKGPGGGGGGSCSAAKDALKTARQAVGVDCADEPTDFVAPPETSVDKYKIFPAPDEGDPSALKSCKEGWMAHTTQRHTPSQCWEFPSTVPGVLGAGRGYKVGLEESRQLTPDACIDLVFKISRETGICNPNYTEKQVNLPASYRFTGCSVEFHDQSSYDVLKVPEHLLDEWKYNNLRGHTKFGRCIMCGQGRLGDGNLVIGHDLWKVPIGKAGLYRRDTHEEAVRMTCIMNPEEKDGFEVHHYTK